MTEETKPRQPRPLPQGGDDIQLMRALNGDFQRSEAMLRLQRLGKAK